MKFLVLGSEFVGRNDFMEVNIFGKQTSIYTHFHKGKIEQCGKVNNSLCVVFVKAFCKRSELFGDS